MIDTVKEIVTKKKRNKGDKTKETDRDITFVKKIMSNGNERDLKGSKRREKKHTEI